MTTATTPKTAELVPFALKDAPALIEKVFPATKVSFEAQRERKAGSGQTLTALGSYWKGRKPLILVRAIVLGSLLPQTEDAEADLEVFEALLGIDLPGLAKRAVVAAKIKPDAIATVAMLDKPWTYFTYINQKGGLDDASIRQLHCPFEPAAKGLKLGWRNDIDKDGKAFVMQRYLESLPSYEARSLSGKRSEEIDQDWLLTPALRKACRHLRHFGIKADTLPELVEQLGILRYGHKPKIGDVFAGGGSIPYEAARIGASVYASDLNPIACMLNWANLNIVGATEGEREKANETLTNVAEKVGREIDRLGVEKNDQGDRAKHYLYCLEARCPETGWLVPMLPTFVISTKSSVIVELLPNHESESFDINVRSGVSKSDLERAKRKSTLSGGRLTYDLDGKSYSVSVKSIRQDYRSEGGENRNRLRLWSREDIAPRSEDTLQERLYAIQWMSAEDLKEGKSRVRTWFSAPTEADLDREAKVQSFVSENLPNWQEEGLIPDMMIEPGYNTSQPIRERGWTYWHHLFSPRSLLQLALWRQFSTGPEHDVSLARMLDFSSKLNPWAGPSNYENTNNVFSNQALNTLYTYGVRGWGITPQAIRSSEGAEVADVDMVFKNIPAASVQDVCDVWITDPPYADAVMYDEITEFFIAWLRKNPPAPFNEWNWDSRRELAIKGSGDDFRKGMVDAYKAMAEHMPDNGMQCVMFTHQDTGVWSDMVGIFWGAGLQVVGAWYIATETTSELKKGGYVQGTVIMMLRKRPAGERKGFTRRIYPAVHQEVQRQIEEMLHLNQQIEGHTGEPVFNDADLQMAGYAAALKVLTSYTEISGEDVTNFALRPRKKGETTVVDEIVQQASETANSLLVPEGLSRATWQSISGIQRFYLRMLDIESVGASKLDNYQNFAKAFRVEDYTKVMASMTANKASLKQVEAFKSRELMETTELGATHLGHLISALQQLLNDIEIKVVIQQLAEDLPDYLEKREVLEDMARFLSVKATHEEVRDKAEILADRIYNDALA